MFAHVLMFRLVVLHIKRVTCCLLLVACCWLLLMELNLDWTAMESSSDEEVPGVMELNLDWNAIETSNDEKLEGAKATVS